MGPIRCPETSVKDYHSTLRNMPEERGSSRNSDYAADWTEPRQGQEIVFSPKQGCGVGTQKLRLQLRLLDF
jgi:hypothetical protein